MSATSQSKSVSEWESSGKKITVHLPRLSIEWKGKQPRYFKRGVIEEDGSISFWSIRYSGDEKRGFVSLTRNEMWDFKKSWKKYYLEVNETIKDSQSDYFFLCTRSPRGIGVELTKAEKQKKVCQLRGCTGAHCSQHSKKQKLSMIGTCVDDWTSRYLKKNISSREFNSQLEAICSSYQDKITEFLDSNVKLIAVMLKMSKNSIQAAIPGRYIEDGKINVFYLFYFFQSWIRHIYKFGISAPELYGFDDSIKAELCDVMICTSVPAALEEIIRRTTTCSTPNCAGGVNCRRGLHTVMKKVDGETTEVYKYAKDRDFRSVSYEIIPDVTMVVPEYTRDTHVDLSTITTVSKRSAFTHVNPGHRVPTPAATGAGAASDFPSLPKTEKKPRYVADMVKKLKKPTSPPKHKSTYVPPVIIPECLKDILESDTSPQNKVRLMIEKDSGAFASTYGMTHRGLNRFYIGVPEVRNYDRVLRTPKAERSEEDAKFLKACMDHETEVCGINMELVKKRKVLSRSEAVLLYNSSRNCEFEDTKLNAVMETNGQWTINKWSKIVKHALFLKKDYLKWLVSLRDQAGSYSAKKKNFVVWLLQKRPTARSRGKNAQFAEMLPDLHAYFLKYGKNPTFKGYLLDFGLVDSTFEFVVPVEKLSAIAADDLMTWKSNKVLCPDINTFADDVEVWSWFLQQYNAAEWKDRFHENPHLAQKVMKWVEVSSRPSGISSDEAWEMALSGDELPNVRILSMSSLTKEEYYQLVDMLVFKSTTDFSLVKDGVSYKVGDREKTLQSVINFSTMEWPLPIELLIEGAAGDFSRLGFVTTKEQAAEYLSGLKKRGKAVRPEAKAAMTMLESHQEKAWPMEVLSGKVDKKLVKKLYLIGKKHGISASTHLAQEMIETNIKIFSEKRKAAKKAAKEEAKAALKLARTAISSK